MNKTTTLVLLTSLITSFTALAKDADSEKELQDMSDPTAVFTQAGAGFTDRGINIKIGKAYDSGKPATMAMNVIEIQGILSDTLGFRDDQVDSIDSARFRNFVIDTTNGLGNQVDVSWNFNTNSGSASYALIQALPKMGLVQFYPLAGLGLAVANGVDDNANGWADGNSPSGISVPGAFANLGMYSKLTITDKIWLNYNPIWSTSIGGSDPYKENTYGMGNSSIFSHEVAMSYQFTPRFNVRYFANWSEHTDFTDGQHRIEFNYQL